MRRIRHRPIGRLLAIIAIVVSISQLGAPLFAAPPADIPFKVGEKLDFKIYFEFILGGSATMAVEAVEVVDGHDCLRIVSEAKSTRAVDRIYKVRDRIATWRDIEGNLSRR